MIPYDHPDGTVHVMSDEEIAMIGAIGSASMSDVEMDSLTRDTIPRMLQRPGIRLENDTQLTFFPLRMISFRRLSDQLKREVHMVVPSRPRKKNGSDTMTACGASRTTGGAYGRDRFVTMMDNRHMIICPECKRLCEATL